MSPLASSLLESPCSGKRGPRVLSWFILASGLAAVAGCARDDAAPTLGGQTGEGSGDPDLVTEGEPEEFANNEATPLGFSAKDVIALTAASELDSFAALWPATFTQGGRALPAESSDAEASFVVAAKGRKSEFFPFDVSDSEGTFGILAVPVTVSLTLRRPDATELRVEAEGKLWAASPHFARLTTELKASDVVGDDAVDLAEGERISQYEIDAHWSALGAAGRLTRIVERDAEDDKNAKPDAPMRSTIWRAVPFAAWPASNDCNEYEHPLPLDGEVPGLKPAQLMTPFNTDGEVRWLDGTRSPLAIGVLPLRNNACINLGELGIDVPDGVYVRLPLKLDATSQDGRWDASYRSEVTALLSHTGKASSIGYSVRQPVPNQTALIEDIGIFGLELGEDPSVQFRLELEATDSRTLTGSLLLESWQQSSPEVLERGTISALAAETGSSTD